MFIRIGFGKYKIELGNTRKEAERRSGIERRAEPAAFEPERRDDGDRRSGTDRRVANPHLKVDSPFRD